MTNYVTHTLTPSICKNEQQMFCLKTKASTDMQQSLRHPIRLCHMRHAITCACLHPCLNLLRCAFYCMSKMDMNPSKRLTIF